MSMTPYTLAAYYEQQYAEDRRNYDFGRLITPAPHQFDPAAPQALKEGWDLIDEVSDQVETSYQELLQIHKPKLAELHAMRRQSVYPLHAEPLSLAQLKNGKALQVLLSCMQPTELTVRFVATHESHRPTPIQKLDYFRRRINDMQPSHRQRPEVRLGRVQAYYDDVQRFLGVVTTIQTIARYSSES